MKNACLICFLSSAACCLIFFTALLGRIVISPLAVWDAAHPDTLLFWSLRLPRSAGAFLAGAGLAVSGMVFQAIFRNPLAAPYTLGISSGAAFGASLYFAFGLSPLWQTGSFFGALCGCALTAVPIWLIAGLSGRFDAAMLLLAGVIINFFFSSLVMLIQYCANAQDALQIMRWLMGSLAGLNASGVYLLAAVILPCAMLVGSWAVRLDLLTLGSDLAASRGLDVTRARLAFFALVSLMVGVTVSLIGPVGFVGIIVPQICRLRAGSSHGRLTVFCFFCGGLFLLLADLLARTALYPAELPIGIITALCGAPFFLWLLLQKFRAFRQ